jgi:hypothetical protein
MLGHFFPLRKAARIGRVRRLAVGFAAVALCGGLLTQAAVAQVATTTTGATTTKTTTNTSAVTWAGLNWGIGIAADFDVGGTRVANATVVNGIVRLTDTSSNVGVSFVLESHYFFPGFADMTKVIGSLQPPGMCTKVTSINSDGSPKTTVTNPDCTEWAHGPFVAIEVGDGSTSTPAANGPITAYALGWMIGFHHPTAASATGSSNNTQSWNFGIGLRIDPKSQVLGDGLVANQPLPAGDSIRYKTEPRAGVMLLSSFSF